MSDSKAQNTSEDELELSEIILSEEMRLLGYRSYVGTIINIGMNLFEITPIGTPETVERSASIRWDDDGNGRTYQNIVFKISDQQWEILKIAFAGSGRIIIFSRKEGLEWASDLSTIRAVKFGINTLP
jgi:hypothetical protein